MDGLCTLLQPSASAILNNDEGEEKAGEGGRQRSLKQQSDSLPACRGLLKQIKTDLVELKRGSKRAGTTRQLGDIRNGDGGHVDAKLP